MVLTEDLIKLYSLYPVLRELPASLQHVFANGCYPVHAEAGEIILEAGSLVTYFLMPTEGTLRVLYPDIEREFLLYRIQHGGVCILTTSQLLTGVNFQVRVEAETAMRGVAVPELLFHQMVDESPVFCSFLIHSFAGRLAGLLELLGAVATRKLDQRLAGLLLTKESPVQTTHWQLADELGSVREVISRILKDFEEKQFLKLERGQIQILDPESLDHLHRFGDSSH